VDLRSAKLRLDERLAGDVMVLGLKGELTVEEGDLIFRQRIHDLLGKGHRKFLLDLAGVVKMDSAGVGMLVAKLKTVRDQGGVLKLLNLTARESRLLEVMRIRSAFEAFDDEAKALESY
jgi:anti-sigma B factor antagonist